MDHFSNAGTPFMTFTVAIIIVSMRLPTASPKRLAPRVRNRLLEKLNRTETEILPYHCNQDSSDPRDPSEIAGPRDRLSLWAGQSANLSACTEVSAVVTSLVDEFSKIAGRLWSGAHMAIGNMRILSPTTAEVP